MPNVGIRRVKDITVRDTESLPALRSGRGAVDIDGFLDLVSLSLDDFQRRTGRSTGDRMSIVQQWPKEGVETPDEGQNLVLFRVISRKPQNTTNEGTRRKWKPTERLTIPHPDDPTNQTLKVYSMRYDHIVEFRVSSPHGARANELALLFEEAMLAYAWFLKEMGVQDVQYSERREDAIEKIGGTELHVRPIRYFVRTEDITQETTRRITDILIHFDEGPALETTVVNDYHGIEDHQAFHPRRTGQTEFD
jgi:hypothetical protein